MQETKALLYIVYTQLVKKPLREKSLVFIIVNDAFIFVNIRFLDGDYAKILSVEAFFSG